MTCTETNKFWAVLVLVVVNEKHAEAARALGRREGLTVERTPIHWAKYR